MKPSYLLSFLRPRCRVLITPGAVVLQAAPGVPPLLRPCSNGSASPAQQLAAAMVLLLQMMDAAGLRGRRVHLVVSDFWARPAVLLLPAKRLGDADTDSLLAKHYRSTYGDLMDGWRWCWSRFGTRLTAVAWPASALEALQAGLAERACVLASAKPMGLVLAGQLPAAPGARWLLILTCAGVSLLRQQQGELIDWCVLADHAGATHWASRLPLQLAREAARRGDACRAVEIIDCEAATDLPLLRQALLDAGWASRVGAPDPFTHWVWRLVSATLTASAV